MLSNEIHTVANSAEKVALKHRFISHMAALLYVSLFLPINKVDIDLIKPFNAQQAR